MGVGKEQGGVITRRDFLKFSCLGLAALFFPQRFRFEKVTTGDLLLDTSTIMALGASESAVGFFKGKPYSWEKNRHCSSFAGVYARFSGLPVKPDNKTVSSYSPKESFPMPDATTVKQVEWLRYMDSSINGAQLSFDIPVKKLLTDKDFWSKIRPGSLIYLQTAVGQHGYNEYSHVVVFIGLNGLHEPVFAEYSPDMKSGPQNNRTLEQISRMYKRTISGWDLEPHNVGSGTPKELTAFVFDTIGLSRIMWRDGGKVVPNSEVLLDYGAEVFITVNINDGTTAIFTYNNGHYQQVPLGSGLNEAYAVVGRKLKVNPELSIDYYSSPFYPKEHSFYDGEDGTLWLRGVPRRTLTPMLIARLDGFGNVSHFGGLRGYSNIAFIRPLYYNNGRLVEDVYRSDYTIHEVPRGTEDQEILLREPDLIKANNPNSRNFGPLEDGIVNRSSGCVNYDGGTWVKVKETIQPYLDNGKKVVVIFSAPKLNQDLQIGNDSYPFRKDPVGGAISLWKYVQIRDRRGFYTPRKYEMYPRIFSVDRGGRKYSFNKLVEKSR